MSTDGQGTKWRRNIAENFNRLSGAQERYRQTGGRQHIATAKKSCSHSRDFSLAFACRSNLQRHKNRELSKGLHVRSPREDIGGVFLVSFPRDTISFVPSKFRGNEIVISLERITMSRERNNYFMGTK